MSAQRTNVEKHPDRVSIELALARNVPLRRLEKRYGVTISGLSRHRQKMRREQPEVFRSLVAANWKVSPEELEALRLETADGWLRQLRAQVDKLTVAQDRNLEAGDDRTAGALGRTIALFMDQLGRALNQLGAHTVHVENAVIMLPAVYALRSAIIDALRPYPEARNAVLRAMRQAELAQSAPALMTLPAAGEVAA